MRRLAAAGLMANPAGERTVPLKGPLRVGLRFSCVTLALTGALLVGCGSGDDRPKVEDSLRDYLGAINPEHSSFPVGAGSRG